jgi:hypothetical protein
MALRLPHVLVLMALVLAAGVLSVQQLEEHVGRSAAPGLVVLDAGAMGVDTAQALVRRWPGMQFEELEWVAADGAPLAPFDPVAVGRLRERGWASALVTPGGSEDAALRRGWGVLVTSVPAAEAPASLSGFVAAQDGVRPFVAGLLVPDAPVGELLAALTPLVAAADGLPSFRRTTIVVLGQRELQSGRRLALRLERGPEPAPGRVLTDLLQSLR